MNDAQVTIWHNHRCSKSPQGPKFFEGSGCASQSTSQSVGNDSISLFLRFTNQPGGGTLAARMDEE